jgi:hypothetical protein
MHHLICGCFPEITNAEHNHSVWCPDWRARMAGLKMPGRCFSGQRVLRVHPRLVHYWQAVRW